MKAEDYAHESALAWRLQSVLPCLRPRQPLRSGSVVPRKENEVRSLAFYAAILPLMATAACEVTVKQGNESAEPANNAAAAPQPPSPEELARTRIRDEARQPLQDLRFLVDISDRKLRLMQGDRVTAEHDVAVGSEEWPTPTGNWQIHRVDLNPEWIPPTNEEWAEEREPKAPGDPDNPMGKARLVYRMPNTIHGTSDVDSLGKASSHGSIRVANEVVLQLAETLLKAGGAWEGPQWFGQMIQNRTREYQIELENPVPIRVQE